MNMIKSILGIALLVFIFQLSSCGNSDNTPVGQYISLLDKVTEQVKDAQSVADISNIQSLLQKDGITELLQDSKDYELSDSDKDKIKKATDKFLKAAFEKSIELSNLPEELKEASKSQMELATEASNKYIDNAKTLGDLTRALN